MSAQLLIYGANGYTGELVARGALEQGLRPLLGGRNEERLAPLAEALGLEYRVASLRDPAALDRALRDVDVVLHAAGPFFQTAAPMVEACLRTRTHYLDLTGEAPVIEELSRRHAEARRRSVMIMPGVGYDVVPSDCLAAHVARRLPGATHLSFGVASLGFYTRGSVKTIIGAPARVRRDGKIVSLPNGSLQREFDYGDRRRLSTAVSWGDVASAFYTTGIPNIEVYFENNSRLQAALAAERWFGWWLAAAPVQVWLRAYADLLPDGPTAEQRAQVEAVIVAEVENAHGERVSARLHSPEAYTFTSVCAPRIAARALAGDLEPGFQTPGRVYGPEFVLGFAGVTRADPDG